jgi:hypothetical protein
MKHGFTTNLYIGGSLFLIFWFSACLSLSCVAIVVGVSGLSIHDCTWKHSSSRAFHLSVTREALRSSLDLSRHGNPSPVPRTLKVNIIPLLHSCYIKFCHRAFIYLYIRKYNTTCISIKHFCSFQISRRRGCWQIKFMFGYKSERKNNIYCYSLLHFVLVNVFETSWKLIDFSPFLNFIIL